MHMFSLFIGIIALFLMAIGFVAGGLRGAVVMSIIVVPIVIGGMFLA